MGGRATASLKASKLAKERGHGSTRDLLPDSLGVNWGRGSLLMHVAQAMGSPRRGRRKSCTSRTARPRPRGEARATALPASDRRRRPCGPGGGRLRPLPRRRGHRAQPLRRRSPRAIPVTVRRPPPLPLGDGPNPKHRPDSAFHRLLHGLRLAFHERDQASHRRCRKSLRRLARLQ
jgi:hypothetical protein